MKFNYLLFFTFLILNVSYSQLKYSGYGATGYKWHDINQLKKYNQEAYYEAKLETEMKFNDEISAEFDVYGDDEDHIIRLKEFSVKYKYSNLLRFRIGNIKKVFGIEQLTSRDEYFTIDDSYLKRKFSDLGYSGRSVSFMLYKNYDYEKDSLPYSYRIAFYKENSLNSGLFTRISYHFSDIAYSLGYIYQHRIGEYKIDSHGFEFDIMYTSNNFYSNFEVFYADDPNENIIRKSKSIEDYAKIFAIKSTNSYEFKIDKEFIKKIQPVLLLGYYAPDSKFLEYHTFQFLIGSDFYLTKKVKLRLNGDLLLTKSRFDDDYSTYDSRVTLEAFVRF